MASDEQEPCPFCGSEADINDATVEFLCKIQERIYALAKKDER